MSALPSWDALFFTSIIRHWVLPNYFLTYWIFKEKIVMSNDLTLCTEKKKAGRKSELGIKHGENPITLKLPSWLKDVLTEQVPNKSKFMRDAIIEKLLREGILESEYPPNAG